ncbi:MAG: UbiX family flavin prenyltransferase [Saprospiraceae bacterium]
MQKLLEYRDQWSDIGIVASANAEINWKLELNKDMDIPDEMHRYQPGDFYAPFASGSARYESMIICPCSMGTLGRIASGISNDLMTRAADVMLKEKRKLILVPRETPLNLIHLRNMVSLAESGAVILPAVPSFYSKPSSIDELIDTVVDRVLDLAGFEISSKRWS